MLVRAGEAELLRSRSDPIHAACSKPTSPSTGLIPAQWWQPPKQFTSVRYGDRLAEIGAVPSIGTVGDSYDNALAETVNGYYKTELIRGPARPGPWRTDRRTKRGSAGHPTHGIAAESERKAHSCR